MAGRFLLDTNAIIALFAQDASLNTLIADVEVLVPTIALGELYAGTLKSGRLEENLRRIQEFASKNEILGCDAVTAWHYGQLKNGLRVKGRPAPENDVWIGAIARQHGLSVLTRDAHFDDFPEVTITRW